MIFVKMERTPLTSTTSRWLGDFTFFQYNRSAPSLLSLLGGLKEDIARSCNRIWGRVSCLVTDDGAEDIFAAGGPRVEYRSLPRFPHSIRGQAHASFSDLYER